MERGFRAELPRNILKTMLFPLDINVTNIFLASEWHQKGDEEVVKNFVSTKCHKFANIN